MPMRRRPKPVRTIGRNWKVYDKEPGTVREVRRWDARTSAAIGGGGLLAWGQSASSAEPTELADPEKTESRRRPRRRSRRAS